MKFFNRVRVNTATVGQGTLTLGSAIGSNMLTLAEAGANDGEETTFIIEEGADFEISRGIVGGSATTITRATVLVSKIGGIVGTSKLELSGSGQVRMIQSAEDINALVDAAPFWQRLLEVVKTTNYTLTKADAGVEVVFNSVSALVGALPPVANSNGELYLVRNIGTGTLTIDPNGAETIEGAVTMALLQGQAVLIWPNEAKSAWRAMAAENSPLKAAMRSMLGLTAAADRFAYFTGPNTAALATLTAFARSLIDDVDAATARATLGASDTGVVISLTSGAPLSQSDVVGATTVYAVPSGGRHVLIYDGGDVSPRMFAETAVTLTTGNHLANTNYDVFAAFAGGLVVFGTGPSWNTGGGTNTARGAGAGSTELETFQGRVVNKNEITLRNGTSTWTVAARQATLVGSIRTTSAGQTEDSKAKRFVSNALCPISKPLERRMPGDHTNTWQYSTATVRQVAADASNKCEVLQCLSGRTIKLTASGVPLNSTATLRVCGAGIGVNSTTVNAAMIAVSAGVSNTQVGICFAVYEDFVGMGFQSFNWLEQGGGADTQTWFPQNGLMTARSGLVGMVLV